MVAIIVGLIFIAFTVFSVMPNFLNWGEEVITFLKGCAPVLAAFIGLISILIGSADIKDKREAAKEEKEAAKEQSK